MHGAAHKITKQTEKSAIETLLRELTAKHIDRQLGDGVAWSFANPALLVTKPVVDYSPAR